MTKENSRREPVEEKKRQKTRSISWTWVLQRNNTLLQLFAMFRYCTKRCNSTVTIK